MKAKATMKNAKTARWKMTGARRMRRTIRSAITSGALTSATKNSTGTRTAHKAIRMAVRVEEFVVFGVCIGVGEKGPAGAIS